MMSFNIPKYAENYIKKTEKDIKKAKKNNDSLKVDILQKDLKHFKAVHGVE